MDKLERRKSINTYYEKSFKRMPVIVPVEPIPEALEYGIMFMPRGYRQLTNTYWGSCRPTNRGYRNGVLTQKKENDNTENARYSQNA